MAEESADSAKLQKGDVIRLDYELWIVAPGGKEELYDTTREELARKEKVHDEKKTYESVPLLVGHDRAPKGLDRSLLDAKIGHEYDVTIPPAEGAGERKPELVELISIREFTRDNKEEPKVGMEVVRKGKRGTITGIAAGRIRIDFNNPLAGKTLKYRYKVVKKAEKLEEKIKDILHMDYGMGEDFRLSVSSEEAEIQLPEVCKYDPNWSLAKYKIVSDLRDVVGVKKIRLIEEYVKKEEEKKEEIKPEEKKEERTSKEKKGEGATEEPKGEKPGENAPEGMFEGKARETGTEKKE